MSQQRTPDRARDGARRSPRVLILDDEPVAGEVLAEASRRLGLAPVVTDRADAALARLSGEPFDLVILDLLLPDLDGLEVARRIRRDVDAHLPILAVSGVYKPASVAAELEAVRARFLRKPLDLALFDATVRGALGLGDARRAGSSPAAPPSAAEGRGAFSADPARVPIYRLYRRLWEERATGTLSLGQERIRRRIAFHQGWIRAATSNLVGETAGGLLVARGRLDRARLDAAVAAAREARIPVVEGLVRQGDLDRAAAQKALGAQVLEVATAAVGMARGQIRFAPEPPAPGGPGPHRVHPLQAAVAGVRRFWSQDALAEWLRARGGRRPQPSDAMRREAYVLRSTTPGEAVWGRIDGRRTLDALVAAARPEDLPLLFVLVATGLAPLGDAPAAAPDRPASAAAVEPAPADASQAAPPAGGEAAPAAPAAPGEAGDAAARIRAEHARLGSADHYAALGVARTADAPAVQAGYLEKARIWHTDRFAGMELGEARPLLEGIFQRIGEARRVLTDPEARREYDIWLDRTEKGLPTDVGAILRAEEVFRVGERLLKAGKTGEALARFDEALALNHAEPEFRVHRAYAAWLEDEAAPSAVRESLAAALAEQPRMASAHYFLGRLAAAEEAWEDAGGHLRRALEIDPEHAEAKAQLARVTRERAAPERGRGGLLKRFLKH